MNGRCFSLAGLNCMWLATSNCRLVCVVICSLFLPDARQDSSAKCRFHTRVQLLIVQAPLRSPCICWPSPPNSKDPCQLNRHADKRPTVGCTARNSAVVRHGSKNSKKHVHKETPCSFFCQRRPNRLLPIQLYVLDTLHNH